MDNSPNAIFSELNCTIGNLLKLISSNASIALFAVALVSISQPNKRVWAQTLILPNELDLRVAYCKDIVEQTLASKTAIALDRETYSLIDRLDVAIQKSQEMSKHALRRLDAYLQPRSSSLLSPPIVAARRIAQEDLDAVNSCMATCSNTRKQEEVPQCWNTCYSPKISTCYHPETFLPF